MPKSNLYNWISSQAISSLLLSVSKRTGQVPFLISETVCTPEYQTRLIRRPFIEECVVWLDVFALTCYYTQGAVTRVLSPHPPSDYIFRYVPHVLRAITLNDAVRPSVDMLTPSPPTTLSF